MRFHVPQGMRQRLTTYHPRCHCHAPSPVSTLYSAQKTDADHCWQRSDLVLLTAEDMTGAGIRMLALPVTSAPAFF
jgi:hypothetical protein